MQIVLILLLLATATVGVLIALLVGSLALGGLLLIFRPVRVHVDDCGLENGPVRVLTRTHDLGKLDPSGIQQLRSSATEVACTARRGGLLAFRPLLLHASSASSSPRRRRVAHFEFAATELPEGLDWQLRWRSEPGVAHPKHSPSQMRRQPAPRSARTDIP